MRLILRGSGHLKVIQPAGPVAHICKAQVTGRESEDPRQPLNPPPGPVLPLTRCSPPGHKCNERETGDLTKREALLTPTPTYPICIRILLEFEPPARSGGRRVGAGSLFKTGGRVACVCGRCLEAWEGLGCLSGPCSLSPSRSPQGTGLVHRPAPVGWFSLLH